VAPAVAEKQNASPVKGQIGLYKDKKVVVFQDQKSQTVVTTPYDKIKSIVYQRTSKHRYAEAILLSPFSLFTKSKKHFLTIQCNETMPVRENSRCCTWTKAMRAIS
jgi:hypothetical protein